MNDLVIACVRWGDHRLPSEQFVCGCGTAIALSKANIPKAAEMRLRPICLECAAARLEDGDAFGGGLVAGEYHSTLERSILAVQALLARN